MVTMVMRRVTTKMMGTIGMMTRGGVMITVTTVMVMLISYRAAPCAAVVAMPIGFLNSWGREARREAAAKVQVVGAVAAWKLA